MSSDKDDLKMMIRQIKPHRKLLSGLKLFKADSARDSWMRRGSDVTHRVEEEHLHHYLPHDLISHHILTRLPIKTLLQFKSVSKEWYSTISSCEFTKMHLKSFILTHHPSSPIEWLFIHAENNYYLLYCEEDEQVLDYYFVKLETNFDEQDKDDELHLVGSCNGLVCLANSSSNGGNYFYIWNPISQNFHRFSDQSMLSFNHRTSWGFAYVSSSDDYKVVRLDQNRNTLEMVTRVFSLKTREWKQINDHGFDHNVSLAKTNPGVLVNETLYWFMDTNGPNRKLMVVGFDLGIEKFEQIHDLIPRSITPWHQFLCVMGGCLSMCGMNLKEEVHVSILKQPDANNAMKIKRYSMLILIHLL